MTYLQPQFDNFPAELTSLARWFVWRNKVPYNAQTYAKGSVTNSTTWSSFTQAKSTFQKGNFDGVGFVLNGDGIIGIDIDKCIKEGHIDERASSLLNQLHASYIEISPSGLGLHAFGYGDLAQGRRRGIVDGLNLEIYSTARYLTVTGNTLSKQTLQPLVGLDALLSKLDKSTEDTDSNSSVSSDSSVGIEIIWPNHVMPKDYGQRHKCLFQLARWLKGTEPTASTERQRYLVQKWHRDHLHNIKTKDFSITWAEWLTSWNKVKHPYGEQLDLCLAKLPDIPTHISLEDFGEKGKKLFRICMALQAQEPAGKPFFISCRFAGDLIDVHFTDAASLLAAFVTKEWLKLVEKGSGRHASRYLMIC